MKTFIPGKDAALEESIERFQTQLKNLGFNIEEASWLNPVPNVWSVHIRDVDAPMNFTNGKGATKKAALASALGEYFERLSTNYFYADYYLGEHIANSEFVHYPNEKWFPFSTEDNLPPEGLLDERLAQFYDPTLELLATDMVDLQSSNMERGVCALPFERQSDKETVYIPMNIIGNLYVSNGMSAGNNRTEARTQGMSEVFERTIKNRIIAERISLPAIPAEVIARFPGIKESIDTLEAEGFPIYCYDASLGGKYPVICVILLNPSNNTCFASFGAHPRFEVALERTVTELLQGRGLKDLDVFPEPSFDDEEVADHHNLETHFIDSSGLISWDIFKDDSDYDFVDWNFEGSSEQEFAHLLKMFHDEGTDVYIADYDHLGVDCCRIIVPGWSEIYPVEELIEANNNVALELRETLLALPSVDWDAEQYAEMYSILEEEGFDDFNRLYEIIGLVPQTGDAWQTLRIGELKCLLALAGGDLELALEFASWCVDYNVSTYSPTRSQFFRCLVASLKLALDEERDPAQYKTVFERMFGQETVAAAWGSIEGTVRFYGLNAGDLTMEQFPAHQKLLNSYHKLQRAKAEHTK
ncbi:ribosomal protein S12 methylthiotransferase accessory factor YcaO [Photobacterium jeanii]|uniref:Ribosomal protein S12 methylthiotransferase accessory factor YcaO n=1 Tax=Photobacterium jeanii TaxID=858640 RepID=A0A178KNH0_9GAMM|nr:30S ribosomal protein S12 methylthiotransferase accessory factor YcaO [Photobacterium jeanii]OAN18646.1 ribosomal protein S12 methylthiotransferase accessory factor YcaO [Photobacterium jeanii]PST91674.1 30S ribosomal protein S12 methylthiotransferase accessory factor YcaO [Photobacterium jeanii]